MSRRIYDPFASYPPARRDELDAERRRLEAETGDYTMCLRWVEGRQRDQDGRPILCTKARHHPDQRHTGDRPPVT
jgi:hypothetical protein